VSVGRFNTERDIDVAGARIADVVRKLRARPVARPAR
jgi:hypothetical protein